MATNGIDKLYADLGIERPKTVRSYLKDTSSFSFQAAENMDKYRREEEQRIKDLAEGRVRTSPVSSLRTLTPARRTTVPQATTKARAQVVGNGSPQPAPTPTAGSTFQALGGSIAKGAVNLVRQVATSQIAGQSILRRGLQTMFETPVLDVTKNIPDQVIGAGKKLWEQNKEEIVKAQQNSPAIQGLQKAETAVKDWADVENELGVTKFFSGLFESAPQSLVTAIPVVGWTMLGSSAFLNGLEQAKIEAEVAGQDPNSDKVMLRALGNMGVEIGTESLFGMFKPIGKAVGGTSLANASRGFFDSVSAKLFKSTGKQVSELSAKTVWKQIAQQATEEGVEEVFAELGNALVLKATTDPNAAMPVFSDYLLAFAGGAIMGGATTGVRGAIALNNLRKLKNFQKALAANSEQTIPELVNNSVVAEALNEDMKDPEVQDAILESQLETIKKYGEQEASQVAEIKRLTREMLEPTFPQYAPTEEEMATSGLPKEWYDRLNEPIPQAPAQAPSSPLMTGDTYMPTQTQEAPPTAPQTPTGASESMPVSATERPKKEYYSLARNEEGKPVPTKREGKIISLESMPGTDFLIYSKGNINKQSGWTIVDARSGNAIIIGEKTRKDAIAKANENIVKLGVDEVKKRVEASVEKFGAMPGYETQIPTQSQPIPPRPTVTQEPTVKVGNKNVTKAQIQNALAKLNKRLENPLNDADRQEITQNIAKWNKVLTKFEQKIAEPLTQSIEEMVAEEGKKEASAESAQGIVATGYAQAVAGAAQAQAKPWRNIESQETQDRIDAAFDPKTQAGWSEKLKDLIRKIQLNVFSGGVPVNPKYGDFRIKYREVGISWQTANKEASSIVTGIYNHAGRSKQELLTRAILYADMMESVNKGSFSKSYSDIFGIKSIQQVLDLYNATQTELKKPENQLAKEAFDMRKERLKAVREPLMAAAARSNVDLSRLANYEDYMTHMILQYSDEFNGIKGKRRNGKTIEYKGRQGSPKDYITNPVLTDFLIMKKMIQDTRKFELYETAKRENKAATLPLNIDGEWIIPEGYAELDPSMLGIKGIEDVLSKQAIMINANQTIRDEGWLLTDPRAKHILSEAREKANRYTMVVPSDMVYAIEKMNQPYNTASKFGQKMQNIWKYSKIRIPGRVWKYNLRNMYGDIDAALMLRPSAMMWVPKSMYQLYQYYYKGRVVDPELLHYIKRNGLITGEARVNMRTFKDIKGLKIYEEKNVKTLGIKGIKKLWSMLTMETFTDFREQILRYATYRSVYSEISKNRTGLPSSYMASIKKEIKSISDIRDRAAKLANDVIGAYDDVSILGKYMADRIMPFYRFYEVNMKRYFRMTMNTFRYDPDLMASQGTRFAKQAKQFGKWGAFTTYKVAKTMIGLGIFQGLMLTLFNNLFAGDDEDKLPEDVKRKPHLTIPGWVFGDDNLHYITDLGSFSEFLSYFGLDYGVMNDIKDIATGRLDVNDYLKNAAKSSLFDVVTGSMPGVQLVIAALGGVTLYPDPTKPVQIKDTLEYLADQAGMKDEYKAIAGLPMPEGQYGQQFIQRIFKEITPGEAAVWDAYDLVTKYRQLNNLGERYSTMFDYKTEDGKRHLAAYNYKVAIKMQDKEAAEKYLAEYIAYGGTAKKFDSVMKWWYPAAGLSKDEKVAFEQWLSEDDEDWTTYADANAFIDSLVTEAGIGQSQMPSE